MDGKTTIAQIALGCAPPNNVALGNSVAHRLDATTDEIAVMFRVTRDMTVDQICLTVANQTDTGTPAQYTVEIQGVSLTTGDPDGTVLDSCTVQWSPSANGLQWTNVFDASASTDLTVGQLIAIVVSAGSSGQAPNASNYIDIVMQDIQVSHAGDPYYAISADTGSTWTPQLGDMAVFGLRLSTATDDVMGNPLEQWYVQSGITAGNNQVLAQGFMLDTRLGRRVQVHGLHVSFSYVNQDYRVGIYDSDATATVIAETATRDIDTLGTNWHMPHAFWDPVWLKTGHLYYAGLKQKAAANNVLVYVHDAVTNDNLSAFSGYPNNEVAYNNTSTWATRAGEIFPECDLLVSGWDSHGQEMQHLDKGMSR